MQLPAPRIIDPASVPALRWGVIGTGIGSQFAGSIHAHSPQRVVAMAGRNHSKTEAVARHHGVSTFYTDVSALIDDPDVDVVYIGTPHPSHLDIALEAIAAGKHVLVEKPIAMTAADARTILDAAASAGVFAMEAMWTRYLPQTDILRQVLDRGDLGEIRLVRADFGPRIPFDPASRFWDAALGASALLDAGIYPLSLASLVLGQPRTVVAAGTVTADGIDVTANLLLTTESDAAALLSTSVVSYLPATAQVVGSTGRIDFAAPFFAPTEMTMTVGPRGAQETSSWRHELPDGATDGYSYEATAFASYVGEGRVESPLQSHDETVSILATIEEVRRQLIVAGRLAATSQP